MQHLLRNVLALRLFKRTVDFAMFLIVHKDGSCPLDSVSFPYYATLYNASLQQTAAQYAAAKGSTTGTARHFSVLKVLNDFNHISNRRSNAQSRSAAKRANSVSDGAFGPAEEGQSPFKRQATAGFDDSAQMTGGAATGLDPIPEMTPLQTSRRSRTKPTKLRVLDFLGYYSQVIAARCVCVSL